MKILFLHLSDAHITAETDISDVNPVALVNSLSQMGQFDELILIFSGDIAFSGKKEEYCNADKLINWILKGINTKYFDGKKFFRVFIVPGNHDNAVINKERNHSDIADYYRDSELFSNDKQIGKTTFFQGCFPDFLRVFIELRGKMT